MTQSIAILRLAALGDVCMTVPLVNRIRKHTNSTLYWIIAKPMYGLVKHIPDINFITIDKPRSWRDFWQLKKRFSELNFDVLLMPQANLRTNLLSTLIKAKKKYGYGALHARDLQRCFTNAEVTTHPEHLVDSFLRFAEVLNISDNTIDWQFPIEPEALAFAKQQLPKTEKPWLAVNLATTKTERNWPVAHYVTTLNQLAKDWQFTVVILGGPASHEKQLGHELEQQLDVPCLNLLGKTNLQQITACLTQVDALLAPDTALTHIANAKDVPVVGLYAVAPACKTGPHRNTQWTIDVFNEAVHTLLKKEPQHISWRQRVHHPKAMQLITPEKVIEKLVALFSHLKFPQKNRENHA